MNYHWASKILLFILSCNLAEAKVTIFTHYFGQPEFIKYQHAFFKKNLLDDYELIVFDDSNDALVSKEIKNECDKYNIKYIRIPRSVFEYSGDPSIECSIAVQYVYDNYIACSNDICLLIDNDIFLIAPFSIEKYLGLSPFSYHPQSRGIYQSNEIIDYMLPNFLILNPSRMPEKESLDFKLGVIEGNRTDSGGFTHFYLKKYRNLGKIISIHYLYNTASSLKEKFVDECPLLFTAVDWSTHYFIDKETFLHLRMGSNWSKHSAYQSIVSEMTFLFDQLLKNN
jgi:hypothetical protein